MKHGLFLPPTGELSDPELVADLAAQAEEAFDGLFLWDHVLRPVDEPQDISDPWIMLAAAATRTRSLRLGPMVTPIVRRRPHKLAREAVTLDRLSHGRLILGLGLGVDTSGELSRFGELVDPHERGDALDEGADLLASYLLGERVEHKGPHFVADNVQLLPASVQQPRVPIWLAARGDARRPLRRAARFEGLFAIEMDSDQLSRAIELVRTTRGSLEGFDVAVTDASNLSVSEGERIGVTWMMWSFGPGASEEEVRARIAAGPGL